MWRRLSPYLLVALVLAAFAGFAWLTRHPDSELLRRAQDWPLLGPGARAFRRVYLPPPPESRPEPRPIVVRVPAPPEPQAGTVGETLEIRSRAPVWVPAETPLLAAPEVGAPAVARVEEIARLSVQDSRGDWLELAYGEVRGWYLPRGDGSEPPLGKAPDPVLPIPGRPPDPVLLQAGRHLLGAGERSRSLGPYRTHTNVEDEELLLLADRVASQLQEAYRLRYRVAPIDQARAAILIFSREGEYRGFLEAAGRPFDHRADGRVERGLVALAAANRSHRETIAILVHELVHLLNRRALGPALPPWLDEGLAEDLAASRIDEAGRLYPQELGGEAVLADRVMIHRGPPAAARLLLEKHEEGVAPSLRRLIEMDQEAFLGGERKLHYALSLFWVRHLVSEEGSRRREGFLKFLQGVSRGEPVSRSRLQQQLAYGWKELEAGFWTWLAQLSEEANGSSSRQSLPPSA